MSDLVDPPSQGPDGAAPVPGADTELSVAAGPLVGPVLRRVVGMLAARASGYAPDAVHVQLAPGDRTLWLRVGPLRPGGASALLGETAVPDVGSVILQLADEVHVDTTESGDEYLRVRLAYAG